MKLAYEMTYLHPVTESTCIEPVPYSSKFQEQYKNIYNACYHEMREALEIKPYDFIQDATFFDEGMENVYLLIEQGEIKGSVALKGEEIDDLIVNPKCQGHGVGKQLLLWAIQNIQTEKVMLHVAAWNEHAVNLYKKCGFEITETIVIGD